MLRGPVALSVRPARTRTMLNPKLYAAGSLASAFHEALVVPVGARQRAGPGAFTVAGDRVAFVSVIGPLGWLPGRRRGRHGHASQAGFPARRSTGFARVSSAAAGLAAG